MPIEYDKTPGGAKGRWKRRTEGEANKLSSAEPEPQEMMRIRIVRPIRSRVGVFAPGQVVIVPTGTARSWIGFGLAEEDKSLSGAPETK